MDDGRVCIQHAHSLQALQVENACKLATQALTQQEQLLLVEDDDHATCGCRPQSLLSTPVSTTWTQDDTDYTDTCHAPASHLLCL